MFCDVMDVDLAMSKLFSNGRSAWVTKGAFCRSIWCASECGRQRCSVGIPIVGERIIEDVIRVDTSVRRRTRLKWLHMKRTELVCERTIKSIGCDFGVTKVILMCHALMQKFWFWRAAASFRV